MGGMAQRSNHYHLGTWIDTVQTKAEVFNKLSSRTNRKDLGGVPDGAKLLECFEEAGHFGFGGMEEGLCCMPGCVSENTKTRERCQKARYCSEEHQKIHYRFH